MVSNYKILRKANLTEELFLDDVDEAALVQEEADRDWAREQDRDVLGEVATAAPAPSAALEGRPESSSVATLEVVTEETPVEAAAVVETKALVKAPVERSWSQILADLTGNPNLEGIKCLGVCGLDRRTGAGAAAAALARWVEQNTDRPALLVEAHFRQPSLAGLFGVGAAGVSDVLLRGSELDEAIQPSGLDKLKVLTGGAPLGFFSRSKVVSEFPALFAVLRERFDAIIVELPAVDDPSLQRLPVASLADAVILVADPKTAQPKKLRRAADQLREARVPLAAAMVASAQTLSEALQRQSGGAPAASVLSNYE